MPTFDAGSIEAKLKLDRSDFNRDLKAAQRDAKQFERDSIEKKLRVDKRDFDRTLNEAQQKAKKLGKESPEVKVEGNTSDWEKDFRKTLAEADELARKSADIKIDANVKTAKAHNSLLALQQDLDRINDTKVKPEVDSSGLALMTGRISLLTTALIGLAPAAIPALTGVTAAAGGLLAVLGAAAPAAGVFGAALIGNIAPALELNKELDKLNKKLEETTDLAKQAEIIEQIGKITEGMTPAVREFVDSIDALGFSWKAFTSATEGPSLEIASRAVAVLAEALGPLPGVVAKIAPVFGHWLNGIESFVAGQGYRQFLGFIMTEGPPALEGLGRLIANLATGVGGLVRSFTPFGQDFLQVLVRGTEQFSTWAGQLGQTGGFRSFIAYVQETGPQMVETLGSLVDSLLEIGQALAPLAGPTLAIVQVFAQMIGTIAELAPGLVQVALVAFTAGRALLGLSEFVLTLGVRWTRLQAAMGTITGFLTGPWGIAIGAATIALGIFAGKHAETEAKQKALKDAIDQTTGAMTQQARQIILTSLAEGNAIGLSDQLGVSYNDVRLAAEGNADAQQRLKTQIEGTLSTMKAERDGAKENSKEYYELNDAYGATYLASKKLFQLIGLSTGPLDEQRAVIRDTQKLMGGYTSAASGLTFATLAEQRAHDAAGKAIREQRDALTGLLAAQKASREEALRLASAEINYEQALDDATAAAKKNGETHDITTQKGRDNERALIALSDAQHKLTDDAKFMTLSAQEQIAVLQDQRKQFIAVAQDMGYTKEQAAALADQYLKTPKEVSTKAKLDAEQKELAEWKAGLDTIDTQVDTVTKMILDNAGLHNWNLDLDGIAKEKETDTSIRGDYEGLRQWQSNLGNVPRQVNTVLNVTLSGYYLAMARLAVLRAAAAARVGGERGGVVGHDIMAFQTGGVVDMRNGGFAPGFSAKDNRIGLFRDGEGVLIPEAVDLIGGPKAIEDLNDSARAGTEAPPRPESIQSNGRAGTAVTIERLIVNNPIGQPTEDTISNQVADMNIIFSP